MNSILQCLSNTKLVLEFCLRGSYMSELNTTLSVMKGSLFKSFANLIKAMWNSNDIVVPSDMRTQIIRFAPKFMGYAQHDAEGDSTSCVLFLVNAINQLSSRSQNSSTIY